MHAGMWRTLLLVLALCGAAWAVHEPTRGPRRLGAPTGNDKCPVLRPPDDTVCVAMGVAAADAAKAWRAIRRGWPSLSKGDSGVLVEVVQLLLNGWGFPAGKLGTFDDETRRQLRFFKYNKDLIAEGVMDADTWLALIRLVRLGDTEATVLAVVKLLRELGHGGLENSRYYDTNLMDAVADFQKKHGLVEKCCPKSGSGKCRMLSDGAETGIVVGRLTWKALVTSVAAKLAPPNTDGAAPGATTTGTQVNAPGGTPALPTNHGTVSTSTSNTGPGTGTTGTASNGQLATASDVATGDVPIPGAGDSGTLDSSTANNNANSGESTTTSDDVVDNTRDTPAADVVATGDPNASTAENPYFGLDPPTTPQKRSKLRLWSTMYYTPLMDNVAGGVPLMQLDGQALGAAVSEREFCVGCALQGSCVVRQTNGRQQAFTFSRGEGSQLADCCKYFGSGAASWCPGTGKARFARSTHPYGTTCKGVAAVPYRTIAVDSKVIPYWSVVYVPAARGTTITLPSGATAVHDGYFFAVDRGGAIKGAHIDTYVGPARKAPTGKPLPNIGSSESAIFDAWIVDVPSAKTAMDLVHGRR